MIQFIWTATLNLVARCSWALRWALERDRQKGRGFENQTITPQWNYSAICIPAGSCLGHVNVICMPAHVLHGEHVILASSTDVMAVYIPCTAPAVPLTSSWHAQSVAKHILQLSVLVLATAIATTEGTATVLVATARAVCKSDHREAQSYCQKHMWYTAEKPVLTTVERCGLV